MRTIADTYVEEGYIKGFEIGFRIGMEETRMQYFEEDLKIGMERALQRIAIKMINAGFDSQIISKITGIPITKITLLS